MVSRSSTAPEQHKLHIIYKTQACSLHSPCSTFPAKVQVRCFQEQIDLSPGVGVAYMLLGGEIQLNRNEHTDLKKLQKCLCGRHEEDPRKNYYCRDGEQGNICPMQKQKGNWKTSYSDCQDCIFFFIKPIIISCVWDFKSALT